MNIRPRKSLVQGCLLAPIFILGLNGISWGAEFWLRAETFSKTMPDASVVTMWGFAQCDNTWNCTPATVPGPRLTVPAGDTVLTINLRNNLTGPSVEAVSLVIPGLTPTAAMTPVKFVDPQGRQRVSAFTSETPADNTTTSTYSWTAKPGTYLYESGSHPAVQVQMGLYGAVTNDAALGQAYGPSTAYDVEALLFFSEIDPVLHGHVAAGTYGTPPPTGITSTMDYEPKYFLINGQPYTTGTSAPIPAGGAGQDLLLRFLSAALKHRVPTVYGMNMTLVAEDGNLYPYSKQQYSLLLSPGKTMDALVMAAPLGEHPVFDRRLGVTNNGTSAGGMLTSLSVVNDLTPPTGSVVINGNAPTTASLDVALTLSATDVDVNNTVTEMRFSWDNSTWLPWEPYATTRNISIPPGANGTKTIFVQFRNDVGGVSATYTDSIDYRAIILYFSTVDDTAVPGVAAYPPTPGRTVYDDADIYGWDGVTFSRVFSARAAGLPNNADIDAVKVIDADTIYMSFNFDTGTTVPTLGSVQDEDIVLYDAGTWSLYLDGTDVGLGDNGNSEDVDAFETLPDGSVLISTFGAAVLPGIPPLYPILQDEDLLRCVGTFGPTTTCTWTLYFDGSDVGLNTNGGEDIDGAAVSGAGGIFLSTLGAFGVTGLAGGGEDIFSCNSPTTGPASACTGFSSYFDGSTNGLPANSLDAFDIP